VDPELAKTRKAHLKRNDFSKVYVKNLKHNLSKPELYMSLAHFDGSRLVKYILQLKLRSCFKFIKTKLYFNLLETGSIRARKYR